MLEVRARIRILPGAVGTLLCRVCSPELFLSSSPSSSSSSSSPSPSSSSLGSAASRLSLLRLGTVLDGAQAMSGARLPSVRLPALAGDEDGSDVVVVELLPASRFGIAWPAEPPPPMSAPAERPAGASLSSSEGETDISEEESAHTRPRSRADECEDSEFVTPTNYMHADRNPLDHASPPPTAPRISRAFSMPLASQLGPFQNPRRVLSSDASPPAGPSEEPVHLQDLSLELADSVQMVIQTLLQLSPPQVLDPAKEQFSACSLSIPTPSISAMFTSMKNLNYMSANMTTFSVDAPASSASSTVPGRSRAEPGASAYVDFDVGEMLQSVGDALSGIAAQAGVDLVLFHDDLGMRHVAVKGDESGLSYTLSHVSSCKVDAYATAR